MLELKSKLKDHSLYLPTDISEVKADALAELLTDVKLPKFYCVVALCFHVKLADIAINIVNAKDATVKVLPILAKISEEDSERMNAFAGDKIIIDRSSLERGSQLHMNTVISSEYAKGYIRDDEELRQNLVKGGDGTDTPIPIITGKSKSEREKEQFNKSPEVFLLSFKVVAVADIVASMPVKATATDPFKISNNKTLVN